MSKYFKNIHAGGFTIVELLVVIVVIGILSTVVFISYANTINRATSESAKASAKSYSLAAEALYISSKTDNSMENGLYYVNKESDGSGTKINGINTSGIAPSGDNDYILFENDILTEYSLTFNGFVVTYIEGITYIVKVDATEALITPTFTINDLTLLVTSTNENVSDYILYANGSSLGSFPGNSTSIDISTLSYYNLTNGNIYDLTLKAYSNNPLYRSSEVSSPVSFQAFTFVKTPLYELGNQYNETTGGWVDQIGKRTSSWTTYPAIFNSDHVYLIEGNYGSGWAQSSIRPINTINYRNYSKLVVEYEISGPIDYMFMAQISISTSFDYTTFHMFEEARANTAGSYKKELDLSGVYNGNAYLKITLVTGIERPCLTYDNLKIYKLYLLQKNYL